MIHRRESKGGGRTRRPCYFRREKNFENIYHLQIVKVYRKGLKVILARLSRVRHGIHGPGLMDQMTINYRRLHRLQLESATKHAAPQARMCTVIAASPEWRPGSVVYDRRHGVHGPGGGLMGQITLNYGRLHTLELKNVIKHVVEPEFVPL